MECGRQCFILFVSSLIAVSLLITSMATPYQLVFVTKPFARVVLGSGQLDSWSAAKLDLDAGEFDRVKENYWEYLRKTRRLGGDDSFGSDESDYELIMNDGNAGERPRAEMRGRLGDSSSSDSSEVIEGEESFDSSDSDLTITERLEDQPLQRTIAIGLFTARMCSVAQNFDEECVPTSVSESFEMLRHEVLFMEQEINLSIWNDLRVESLLSTAASCIGILCVLASFKPCCVHKNAPVYLGAMFFAISGVMAFIPIVRILMISGDFRDMLVTELNITTSLGFSWSILAAGISIPFSALAAILLIAGIWGKTKRIVRKLLKGVPEVNAGLQHEGYKGLVKRGPGEQSEPVDGFNRGTNTFVDPKAEPV